MPIPPDWNVDANPYLVRCPVCEGAGATDEEPDTCTTCRGLGATATPDGIALAQALAILYGYATAIATVDNSPEETDVEAEVAATANREDPETPRSRRAKERGKRGRTRTAKETDRAPTATRRRAAQGKPRRAAVRKGRARASD